MNMKIKRIGDHALPLPARETPGAAGYDLRARLEFVGEMVPIGPGDGCAFRTGFAVEIPPGFVGMVCPRSGLARSHGITVLNAPGIIDSDFRGEIGVILFNHGYRPHGVLHGDRIAQLVIVPIATPDLELVEELDDTARGAGGFGSTGK